MYAGIDFDAADPSEIEIYCFDFVNDLAPGDSIVSAVWFCTVAQGTDATPSDRLIGTPFLVNATKTTQLVGNMLAGVTYILRCVCRTAVGNTIEMHSHVVCEEAI